MEKYLTDKDLRKNKYSLDVLSKNIHNLSLKTLLKWQTLDAEFCKKYILNEKFQTVEDYYLINVEYVLKCQPHLKCSDLQ